MNAGWRHPKRFVQAAAAIACALAPAPAAEAQTVWEPLDSGTGGETITAIEYQSSDRFWITTPSRILKRSGDTFVAQSTVPGANFREIQFNRDGTVGVAVGGHRMWRFNGAAWTEVTGLQTYPRCFGNPLTPIAPDQDLTNVRWTDARTVYAFTGGRTLLKSTDAGVTFDEINIQPDGSCRIDSGIEDLFALPADPNYLVFLGFQAAIFLSTNGLSGKAALQGRSVSCFGNRLWVDEHNPLSMYIGGKGCAWFVYAEDGKTFEGPKVVGSAGSDDLYDFDVNASTTLSAGDAGYILTSVDHRTAYVQPAAGSYATQDWRAVDLASPSEGAVGGIAGALVTSRNVDATPTPTPTPATTAPATPTSRPLATVTPTPRPRPTPSPATRPSKRVAIKFGSGFQPPPGISRSRACTGRVTVRLRVGRRTLASTSVHLNRRCRYRVRFDVLRTRLRGARQVRIVAHFRGNRVLGPRTATYRQRVPG